MPNFDDVVDLLENAERDLEHELDVGVYDEPVAKSRSWKFETAHLRVYNSHADLNHRALLAFLGGIRESGFVFGFWEGHVDFFDTVFTETQRGTGVLSPRSGEKDDA